MQVILSFSPQQVSESATVFETREILMLAEAATLKLNFEKRCRPTGVRPIRQALLGVMLAVAALSARPVVNPANIVVQNARIYIADAKQSAAETMAITDGTLRTTR